LERSGQFSGQQVLNERMNFDGFFPQQCPEFYMLRAVMGMALMKEERPAE
jgi:hypothetical protein